jgi:hypothetical protein
VKQSEDNYDVGPGWFYSARATTDTFSNYTINPGIGPVRLIHRIRPWACEEPFVSMAVSRDQQLTALDMSLRDGFTKSMCSLSSTPGSAAPLTMSSRFTAAAKEACFIFLRTLLAFMPSSRVGRVGRSSAHAVINPHNSSQAFVQK